MIRPAPHVAARRRLLVLYVPALVLAAALFLTNASLLNGGAVFGGLALLVFGTFAVADVERNA